MRKVVIISLLMLLCPNFAAQAQISHPSNDFAKNKYQDIALIYYGYKGHLAWNEKDLTPYVTHTFSDGHTEWLFPAFLYINFASDNAKQFRYVANKDYATRAEWEWYLNRLFEKNAGLNSLNNCIERQKTVLGAPPFRHKLIVTLPIPVYSQTNWGKIDKKKMNFNKGNDRFEVCKWFIDEFLNRFADQSLGNLDFEGFYWLQEGAKQYDRSLIREVADYIHSKGYTLYWIPYYKGSGVFDWKSYNLDIAYLQTGYCLSDKWDLDVLKRRIDYAKSYGMGLEFEANEKYFLKRNEFAPRLRTLIDTYEKKGVFDDCPLTYFLGHELLIKFAQSNRTEDHLLIDRLARHIVERHPASPLDNSTRENTEPQQGAKGSELDGRRGMDPDKWVF